MTSPLTARGRRTVHARARSDLIRRLVGLPWAVLGVISIGGALGSLARYGLSIAVPHQRGAFPWGTLAVNVIGCLLIGALMVLITDVWVGRRLLRPFLGIGVLGGFTTFSTYILEVQQTLAAGEARIALAYLAGTVLVALTATWVGAVLARWLTGARRTRTARNSRTARKPRKERT